MSEILVLDNFSLLPQGPTLSMSLGPGQSLCVVGPGGAGKTRLMRVLTREERPAQGLATILGSEAIASSDGFSRRTTPHSIAKKAVESRKASEVTDALVAARLWDHRQTSVQELTPSQHAAAELLPVLASQATLLLIDGQLDLLDPWALSSVMERLRNRAVNGAAIVVATNRLDIVPQFDMVLVLKDSQAKFAGRFDDLIRSGPESEIEVSSRNQEGVRALVEPFKISVKKSDKGLVFKAEEGQQIAARLLVEGYGDVNLVVLKQPTAEDALLKLIP